MYNLDSGVEFADGGITKINICDFIVRYIEIYFI